VLRSVVPTIPRTLAWIGLLLAASSPRAGYAAGCHRGDRPIVDQFQALWIDATGFDPLLEPTRPLPQADPFRLTHRPCSTPAPRDAAPGHASQSACLNADVDPLQPPEPIGVPLPLPLTRYESPLAPRLCRPPRPSIAV
jgi:hypothetical protein